MTRVDGVSGLLRKMNPKLVGTDPCEDDEEDNAVVCTACYGVGKIIGYDTRRRCSPCDGTGWMLNQEEE